VSSLSLLRWFLLILLGVAITGGATSPHPTYATFDPCSLVQGNPGPPSIPPEPTIAGVVSDTSTSTVMVGATMRLYRCVQGVGLLDASTVTDDDGHYAFDDLTEAYYYVAAVMTGPLAGMEASDGYTNPSAVIAVGDGDPSVAFGFE
jgi:hypothetical protein